MANPTIYEIAGKYLSLYEAFYKEVDPQFKGIIKAQQVAAFLKRSNLTNQVLGQIWEIADKGVKGYLDKENFFTALKFVACAQQGRDFGIYNLTVDMPAPIIASQAESPSLPAFGAYQIDGGLLEWAIKSKDQSKYDEIFHSLGPLNGKLSGEQVRPVLLNSGLSNEMLGKIWELSDLDKDGFLDRDEMCVALHLVYRALENDPVPNMLPPTMIPPSKRRPSLAGSHHQSLSRKTSALIGGVKVLPPQASLSRRSRTSSITSMDSVGMVGGPQSPNTVARSLTGTPVPTAPVVKPPAPWIVDKYKWEQVFNDADLNMDGLVNGDDVKNIFLQTGLAQAYLAHIWTLCDINSTGFLNLEQFALAMHFVQQKKQYNVEPPADLPPDLVPPSFRHNPAGMTDIATSTYQELPNDQAESKIVGNKEIDQILNEIRDIQHERREFEQQIVQLEADMTVKCAEIRNLEVELNTLQSTVKQLDRQKGEAQRRLDDLDNQRNLLDGNYNDLMKRNEDDLQNLNNLRSEIEDSSNIAKGKEALFNEKRKQLQTLTDEELNLETRLQQDRKNLHNLHKEQQYAEDLVIKSDDIAQQLRQQREFLVEKLEKLEQIMANNDQKILDSNPILMSMDDEFNLNKIMGHQFMSSSSSINSVIEPSNETPRRRSHPAFDDPFKSHDPFADQDPFASAAPIEDPFASSDPFASHAHPPSVFDEKDAFGVAGGVTKKAPPRPAPPVSKTSVSGVTPTLDNDPFSSVEQVAAAPWSSSGTGAQATTSVVADPFLSGSDHSTTGFANFADFSKFT